MSTRSIPGRLAAAAAVILAGCLLLGCPGSPTETDNDTPPADSPGTDTISAGCEPVAGAAVEFLFPRGGETFTTASVATMKWRVDTRQTIDGMIFMSVDSGKTWPEFPIQYLEDSYYGAAEFTCDSIRWYPQTGTGVRATGCMLRYTTYMDPGTVLAQTGMFTIEP